MDSVLIFDQSSSRRLIDSQPEDPDFVLIIFHAEVVDLVGVVHLLQEYDQFLFAETR